MKLFDDHVRAHPGRVVTLQGQGHPHTDFTVPTANGLLHLNAHALEVKPMEPYKHYAHKRLKLFNPRLMWQKALMMVRDQK